jgi:hypothetical protein
MKLYAVHWMEFALLSWLDPWSSLSVISIINEYYTLQCDRRLIMYHEATVNFSVEDYDVDTPTCHLKALLYGNPVSTRYCGHCLAYCTSPR